MKSRHEVANGAPEATVQVHGWWPPNLQERREQPAASFQVRVRSTWTALPPRLPKMLEPELRFEPPEKRFEPPEERSDRPEERFAWRFDPTDAKPFDRGDFVT